MTCKHGKSGVCAVCEELGAKTIEINRLRGLLEEAHRSKPTSDSVVKFHFHLIDEFAGKGKVVATVPDPREQQLRTQERMIREKNVEIAVLRNQVKSIDANRHAIMSQRNHWVNECSKSDQKVRELQHQLEQERTQHQQDKERLDFLESFAKEWGVRHTLNLTVLHTIVGKANVRTGIDRLISAVSTARNGTEN